MNKNISRKKYNKKDILKTLLYVVLLFSFFEPAFLEYYIPSVSNMFGAFRYLSFGIISIIVLSSKSMSKVIAHIFIYLLVLLISSISNNLEIINTINLCVNIFGLCMITDYGVRNDTKHYLKAMCLILNVLVIFNFITILLYSDGMYINNTGYSKNWILGYKNTHILYILPCVVFNVIKDNYLKQNTLTKYFIIIVSLLSTFLVNNSTGIIGILLLLSFLLFPKIFDNVKTLNSKNYLITYLIMYVSIVMLRLQEIFRFLIVDFLHKDLTFTGRIYIWDKVIETIKHKLVLGYGNSTYQYSLNVFTTHNTILDIIYKTGIIGLVVYILILFRITKQLYIHRENKMAKLLSICLLVYFIMMITESYSIVYYFYILVLCNNVNHLEGGESHE